MGNRGVLGLERLSPAQQREFWRLAARGKSAPDDDEGDDGETEKLSKKEAEGEEGGVPSMPLAQPRGRFRGVTRYKHGQVRGAHMGQGRARAPRVLRRRVRRGGRTIKPR